MQAKAKTIAVLVCGHRLIGIQIKNIDIEDVLLVVFFSSRNAKKNVSQGVNFNKVELVKIF